MGSSLEHMGTGNHFLNKTPVAETLRPTVNKWVLLKLRSFFKVKDIVKKTVKGKDLHPTHIRKMTNLQNISRTQETRLQNTK